MKILSHKFDPKQAAEIVVLEDAHGRVQHVHIPILRDRCPHCGTPYPGGVCDPDEILREMLAIHEDQEAVIAQHIAERFDPKTLEKLK
jgi:hypothetical protein